MTPETKARSTRINKLTENYKGKEIGSPLLCPPQDRWLGERRETKVKSWGGWWRRRLGDAVEGVEVFFH
jgi:hypothetical protein